MKAQVSGSEKRVTDASLDENIISMITERLNTGEKFPPETQLAKDLGVSRTALREALNYYEASGIITSIQGSGRYVQVPNISNQIVETWGILVRAKPELLLDFLEIRHMLEISSLSRAVERVSVNQLQHLGEQVTNMKREAAEGRTFAEWDREFHRTLFESTGNVLLEQLLTAFWDLYQRADAAESHSGLREVAAQHEDILEAFTKRDMDRLVVLMEEQFADARYRITMKLINEEES